MPFNTTMMDTGLHRQPRFGYVPLLGLLLANLLSNTAVAKYAPLGALRLTYEPVPYLKPVHQSHNGPEYWHAVNNPDGPPSPGIGSTETTETQVIHHHHHLPTGAQQQIVNINERPTEIFVEETETEGAEQAETTPVVYEERAPELLMDSNLETPGMGEHIAEESRLLSTNLLALVSNNSALATKNIVKRGTSGRYVKTRKNNKYGYQKRRRIPTTTPEDYYDSYEDASATTTTTRRYKPKRRTSKPRRPILIDSYEDSESNSYSDLSSDEDYDYELTTKPQKRRRTTTTTTTERYNRYRNKNKNKKHQKRQKVSTLDDYDDVEYDTERYDPTTTEIFRETERPFLRQRQQTTDAPDPETTTVMTMLTAGTTEHSNTTHNNTNTTGYGYGPSNGNEDISITYGPPTAHGGSPGSYNPPSSSYGAPSYYPPSSSFVPSPSFNPPSSSYNPPSTSYGVPSSSNGTPGSFNGTPGSSHGTPTSLYGTPSSSYGTPSHSSYYQVPFSDWYSNEVTRNNIVHKVHDIIGFDKVFN